MAPMEGILDPGEDEGGEGVATSVPVEDLREPV